MKRGHVPVRTCKGCGRKAPKSELQRFVFELGHLIEREQGEGYGLYCCPDDACRKIIDKKLRKRLLSR